MEMREGLDLGYNVNKMLVAVLGNPWFTNSYVYWCLSALLLSWPLRVMIEYKTQYVEYQVKKTSRDQETDFHSRFKLF